MNPFSPTSSLMEYEICCSAASLKFETLDWQFEIKELGDSS